MSFDLLSTPYSLENHRFDLSGEGMVLHCHHYNAFLQRSIMDAEYIDSVPFLIGAAAESVYTQLKGLFQGKEADERFNIASELYRQAGFGTLDFSSLSREGGKLATKNSHYGVAWNVKFGTSERPVNFFSSGFCAGAYAALFDLPLETVQVNQTTCLSQGKLEETFELGQGDANFSVFEQKKEVVIKEFSAGEWAPGHIPVAGITETVSKMPLVGNEEGLMPVFGVYLTRMYADYYNRISFEFERIMEELVGEGGIAVSSSLFIEAGHVCAFNTFGGIMTSTEWDSLIKPALQTKEDWVYAMVAVVNSLGWGTWTVTNVSEEGADFELFNDYESLGYESMYGVAKHPVSYLALGAAAGILDLVYVGNVHEKPEFTEAFYERLFKGDEAYSFEFLSCRAQGDASTKIKVSKSS